MEILFEIIFEGVLKTAVSESRRVSLPLRILCALFVFAVYGGIVALMIFGGVVCWRDGEALIAVLLFVFSAGIAGVLMWQLVKAFRRKN